MNFTKFDLVIIFVASIAVVLMSFVFPAAGLTGAADNVNDSEIPTYNATNATFDIVGDFPEEQHAPSQGTLEYYENDTEWQNVTANQFVVGTNRYDSVGSVEFNITDTDSSDATQMSTNYTLWSAGVHVTNSMKNFNEGDVVWHEIDGSDVNHTMRVQAVEVTNLSSPDTYAKVEWKTTDMDGFDDTGWEFLRNIPIIGGIFGAGEQLASIVAWLGAVNYWFWGTLVEVAVVASLVMFDTVTYGIDTMVWLHTTYLDIVSATNTGWGTTLVVLPAVLLYVEFAKVAMIAVSLLPTT